MGGTPADRQAAHVAYDGGSDLRVFLRPASGADLPLYPSAAGLGQLAETAVTQALPLVLDAVADHAADAGVIGEAGTLVAELGDALALRTGGHFSAAALQTWATDPATALVARLPALTVTVLGAIADAIAPLLPGNVGADVDAGALRIVVGAATVRVTPVPFAIAVSGTATGIPAVDRVALGLALDEQGLAALDVEVGPADIDAGGITLRPFAGVHAGRAPVGGRRVEIALGLGDDRRVGARWLLGGSLDLVVVDPTGEHLDPADVAVALLEAVLDLVAGFVLDAPVIVAVLDTEHVGTASIRDVLQGVVLSDADPQRLDTGLFDTTRLLAAPAAPRAQRRGGQPVGDDRRQPRARPERRRRRDEVAGPAGVAGQAGHAGGLRRHHDRAGDRRALDPRARRRRRARRHRRRRPHRRAGRGRVRVRAGLLGQRRRPALRQARAARCSTPP